MNTAEFVYSLYVVLMGGVLVAGIVEGSRWLVTRWGRWSIRREMRRDDLEHEREQRAWRATWGGDY